MGDGSVLGVAAQLAAQWAALRFEQLPDEVVTVAQHCVLDWLGCAVAGSIEPLTGLLRDEAIDDGGGLVPGGSGVVAGGRTGGGARLVGGGQRVGLRWAALVNGAAGHALDYDDTHTVLSGHPTAPVLPAVLALGEHLDVDGEGLLAALVVGIEVECRIGALLNPGHYRAGWHATGTLGTFGAAAACAHLHGLDPVRFAHALGLAATQAAGVKASFGTMGKPLHAGKAAADGLLAARLAARGFTGRPEAIEAAEGYGPASGTARVDPTRLDRYDGVWLVRDTLFKHHAACYLTHAAINAALALPPIDIDDIDRIEVHVGPETLGVCAIPQPSTGLEGKFSLRATTAMALLGDDTSAIASYSDERMHDTALVALRDRIEVVPDPGRASTTARVVLTTRGGRRVEAADDTGRAAADLDVQGRRLGAKCLSLVAPVLGDEAASAVAASVEALAGGGTVRRLVDAATAQA